MDKTQNILDVSVIHGLSEAFLRKGPLDADKNIAETFGGQIVLILDMSNDTSKGREMEIAKGLALGADAYITKPYSNAELVAKVKELLEGTYEKAK